MAVQPTLVWSLALALALAAATCSARHYPQCLDSDTPCLWFSDLSKEEFRAMYTGFDRGADVELPEYKPRVVSRADADLPTNYTSPYSTSAHPRPQGSCGSCWAFVAAAVAEGAWLKTTGSTERFAPQQLLDCDTSQNGCRSGSTQRALYRLSQVSTQPFASLMRDEDYPYTGSKKKCVFRQRRAVGRISKVFAVGWNEDEMDSTLYDVSPLAVYLDSSLLSSYSGGIIQSSSECKNGVDHVVALVGWGQDENSGQKYWVFKNSWGPKWGEDGFFRMVRGKGACLITQYPATGAEWSEETQIAECEPTRTCSSEGRVCGTLDNGCTIVSCGTCGNSSVCLANGTCLLPDQWSREDTSAGSSDDDGIQHLPSNGVEIVAKPSGNMSTYYWTSSTELISESLTSFTVAVSGRSGVFGMGASQPDFGTNVWWQVDLSSASSALLRFCSGSLESPDCARRMEVSWSSKTAVNFTVTFQRREDSVLTWTNVNNEPIVVGSYSGHPGSSETTRIGPVFVFSSGGFDIRNPSLRTRTSVQLELSLCQTQDRVVSVLTRVLGIDTSFISGIVGNDKCRTNYGSGAAGFRKLFVTFEDSATPVNETQPPLLQMSRALAARVLDMAQNGTLADNGADVASAVVALRPAGDTERPGKLSPALIASICCGALLCLLTVLLVALALHAVRNSRQRRQESMKNSVAASI
eukprot:m51a1_g10814 hypothetical protein (695) ;mRNA; r:38724-41357